MRAPGCSPVTSRSLRGDDSVDADVVNLGARSGSGTDAEHTLQGVDGGLDQVVQVGLGPADLVRRQEEVDLDLHPAGPGGSVQPAERRAGRPASMPCSFAPAEYPVRGLPTLRSAAIAVVWIEPAA